MMLELQNTEFRIVNPFEMPDIFLLLKWIRAEYPDISLRDVEDTLASISDEKYVIEDREGELILFPERGVYSFVLDYDKCKMELM